MIMKYNNLVSLLKSLKNNDGATLKNGESITYPNGYQVADYGKETKSAKEAAKFVEEMNGDAGLWYSDGVFYVDHSIKMDDLENAVEFGKQHNQQSIFNWKNGELIWLNEKEE